MSLAESCPRCGGVIVEEKSSPSAYAYGVVCGGCKTFWTDERSLERECIARDLAGTRAKKFGKEYLKDTGEGSLDWDLHELVSLVALATLQEVQKGVEAAIEGRMPAEGKPLYEKHVEIEVLNKMKGWVEGMMEMYGPEKEELE